MNDNELWKAALTGRVSNTNADIMIPQIKTYKGILACSPRCCRHQRIDEADINTPVSEDQRAVNCMEEVVQSFIAMRTRCPESSTVVTFLHPLPVFRVVRCSSVYCFQTRITVELFRCTRAVIAQQKNPPSRRLLTLPLSNSISS
ncbi:uncharacterized protein TNCV_4683051 [Trichonephila clavipes]|nr:uncharacterized protein TNCV_4683051 [Trichonephila clavipes]